MDFTYLAPKELHNALWFIACYGNMRVRPYDRGSPGQMVISIDKMPKAPAHIKPELDRLVAKSRDVTSKTALLLLTSVMKEGPRFFKPTAIQCEAMEHMTLDIEVSEYVMPYKHLIVVLPDAYRQSLRERFPSVDIPRGVLVWEESSYRIIALMAIMQDAEFCCLIPDRPGSTIEDRLKSRQNINPGSLPVSGAEFDLAELVERVALNMALVLEGERHTLKPVNAGAMERYKKALKDPKKRNEVSRPIVMTEILLDQSIKFHEEKTEPRSPQGGAHASPRPHWRKGHFRMQAYGVGKFLRKRIRIKPILVRRSNLVLGETPSTVTYVSKEKEKDHQ